MKLVFDEAAGAAGKPAVTAPLGAPEPLTELLFNARLLTLTGTEARTMVDEARGAHAPCVAAELPEPPLELALDAKLLPATGFGDGVKPFQTGWAGTPTETCEPLPEVSFDATPPQLTGALALGSATGFPTGGVHVSAERLEAPPELSSNSAALTPIGTRE